MKKKTSHGVKILEWVKPEEQTCSLGKSVWSIPRLFNLSSKLPVLDVPIEHLNIYNTYKEISLREMVSHFNAVNAADLSYPIILDEDGIIMDGRHRIMKALMLGRKTIKAVRFEQNPPPCRYNK